MAQHAADHDATLFDLEHRRHAEPLRDPMLALEPLRGLVIIDEAQHAPGLFPVLRYLADRLGEPARFLVLGTASPELVGLSAESLTSASRSSSSAGCVAACVHRDGIETIARCADLVGDEIAVIQSPVSPEPPNPAG